MARLLKKGDFIVAIAVLILIFTSGMIFFINTEKPKTVTVSKNNTLIYEGSLYENKTVKLDGNIIEIKNGRVKMLSADCKNRICINSGEISQKGESIVCLPNKVIAEIK